MINIVTLSYNRPDFIELQLKSIQKFHKDFTYTVFDNAPDDSVKDECERLGVKCIPVKIFSEDTSWCVGLSLNKMWETLRYKKGILVYLDSDMFLVDKLPDMKEYDFAFVPQVRPGIMYPWTGLMLFNMDTLPNPHKLRFEVNYSLKDTDVGGLNHFYLKDNDVNILELEMWTLIDNDKYSFNGADSSYDRNHGLMGIIAETYYFPRPYSFDMLKAKDGEFFVFHYKSGSNYPSFYTPKYNELKTASLKKFI